MELRNSSSRNEGWGMLQTKSARSRGRGNGCTSVTQHRTPPPILQQLRVLYVRARVIMCRCVCVCMCLPACIITAQPRTDHRNAAFAVFSAGYLGCGQHYVYNVLFTRVFGVAQTASVAAKKVSYACTARVACRRRSKVAVLLYRQPLAIWC